MDANVDALLSERHPRIFLHDARGPTSGAWGFECLNGWFNIIDTLAFGLQAETDEHGAPQVIATQVKEKYGTLRFYVATSNATQNALIHMAERLSATTCDVCGGPGMLRTTGWYATRCDAHAR